MMHGVSQHRIPNVRGGHELRANRNIEPSNVEPVAPLVFSIERPLFPREVVQSYDSRRSPAPKADEEAEAPETLLDWLEQTKSENSITNVGRVASLSECKLTYLDDGTLANMIDYSFRSKSNTRRDRKERYVKSVINDIKIGLDELQRSNGQQVRDTLGEKMRATQSMKISDEADDDEEIMPAYFVDPGPFSKWGQSWLTAERQPTLKGDKVLCMRIVKNEVLEQEFDELIKLIGDIGLNKSMIDKYQWMTDVPVFFAAHSIGARTRSTAIPKLRAFPDQILAEPLTVTVKRQIQD